MSRILTIELFNMLKNHAALDIYPSEEKDL